MKNSLIRCIKLLQLFLIFLPAFFRCFLLTFTFGFSILSAWITNVADVIYARNFDSITLQQQHRKTTLDSAAAGETGNTVIDKGGFLLKGGRYCDTCINISAFLAISHAKNKVFQEES